MRDWALGLLCCLECGATSLESTPGAVLCAACGTRYPQRGDVVDFLHRPHPAVVRERDAVHRIDREDGASPDCVRALLTRLESGAVTETDLASSAHTRAITESREQVMDLLSQEPLTPGATVLEIGADVGWASSILLKAGCRVIATDITDHLFLAPEGQSPDLCRIQADMNRMPLHDSSVDVVFGASCVHHSWNLGNTFGEIARVLKPGGRVYLCGEPIPSLPRFIVGTRFGHKERALGINETWIRRGTWLRHCQRAGLEPRIVFPRLTAAQLRQRLEKRRLPGFLAGVVRPILPVLQVSVHLRADKTS
jgi:SAM-dependent methyltransferase